MKLLPFDVVVNHILPFAYKPQSKEILVDIRSYHSDCRFLENIYFIHFNPLILMNDLIRYCNDDVAPIRYIQMKYAMVLKRNFILQKKRTIDINEFVFSIFHNSLVEKTNMKIKFLLALLTPAERSDFISSVLFNLEN